MLSAFNFSFNFRRLETSILMKRIVISLLLAVVCTLGSSAQTPEDSTAFFNGKWEQTRLGKGAVAVTVRAEMFDSQQLITFIRYPVRRFRTEILDRSGEKAGKTSVLASDAKARFAINGGYFNGDYTATSFFKTENVIHRDSTSARSDTRCNGAVCVNRSGRKIVIKPCRYTEHKTGTCEFYSVLTCGPVLLHEGEVYELRDLSQGFVFKRHPRTIFGIDGKGYAYMIVIDGRHKGQAAGATIPEATFISRILGLKDAINLDGGGSSTIWSEDAGVMNYPCDNRKFDHEGERKIPNLIIAR